jgi:hypothetical protein
MSDFLKEPQQLQALALCLGGAGNFMAGSGSTMTPTWGGGGYYSHRTNKVTEAQQLAHSSPAAE